MPTSEPYSTGPTHFHTAAFPYKFPLITIRLTAFRFISFRESELISFRESIEELAWLNLQFFSYKFNSLFIYLFFIYFLFIYFLFIYVLEGRFGRSGKQCLRRSSLTARLVSCRLALFCYDEENLSV